MAVPSLKGTDTTTREQVYVYLQPFVPFAEQVGKLRQALDS